MLLGMGKGLPALADLAPPTHCGFVWFTAHLSPKPDMPQDLVDNSEAAFMGPLLVDRGHCVNSRRRGAPYKTGMPTQRIAQAAA